MSTNWRMSMLRHPMKWERQCDRQISICIPNVHQSGSMCRRFLYNIQRCTGIITATDGLITYSWIPKPNCCRCYLPTGHEQQQPSRKLYRLLLYVYVCIRVCVVYKLLFIFSFSQRDACVSVSGCVYSNENMCGTRRSFLIYLKMPVYKIEKRKKLISYMRMCYWTFNIHFHGNELIWYYDGDGLDIICKWGYFWWFGKLEIDGITWEIRHCSINESQLINNQMLNDTIDIYILAYI